MRRIEIGRIELERCPEAGAGVLRIAQGYVNRPLQVVGQRVLGLLCFECLDRRQRFVEGALAQIGRDQRNICLVLGWFRLRQRLEVLERAGGFPGRQAHLCKAHTAGDVSLVNAIRALVTL